jgi:hypothetical protein
MEGNARSFRYGLRGLVILAGVAAVVACSKETSKPSDTGTGVGVQGSTPGPGPDLASLERRVDSLEAYRVRNAAFVEKLWASYSHFYYCDVTTEHKDPKMCGQMQSHVQPPSPPAPK